MMRASYILFIAAVAASAGCAVREAPDAPAPVSNGDWSRVTVTVERPPSSSDAWRITSSGVWTNDLSGETVGLGAALPVRPALGPQMYVARFDHDAEQWKSVYPFRDGRERPVPWSGGRFIRSSGPWWPDPNHDIRADGTLGLNLVAYMYSRDLLPNVHDREIDLRNARFEFRIRGSGLALRGAELVFWVQARPRGLTHFVNLALTARPITAEATSGEWTDVVLDLDPDAGWTCLGAGPLRQETYGCAAPAEVLADVNRDFGFILYPVWLDDSGARAPRGSISLDDILLTYRLNSRRPAGGS